MDLGLQGKRAVQLRYLQTMREVASERNTTTFFPLPIVVHPVAPGPQRHASTQELIGRAFGWRCAASTSVALAPLGSGDVDASVEQRGRAGEEILQESPYGCAVGLTPGTTWGQGRAAPTPRAERSRPTPSQP